MLAMTPSGSCEMRSSSFCRRRRRPFPRAARAPPRRGRNRCAPSRPFSSLRDCGSACRPRASACRGQRLELGATRSRKRAIASRRCFSGIAAHAGCAARARSVLARGRWRRRRRRPRRRRRRSAGLSDLHGGGSAVSGAARGEEIVEQRRVVEHVASRRAMEFGMPLHAEHVRRPGPADRLDHAVGLRPGLDDEVAAEVLDRLVVDRVGLGQRRRPEQRAPGRVPGDDRVAWTLRRRCPGRDARARRDAACRCPGRACRRRRR